MLETARYALVARPNHLFHITGCNEITARGMLSVAGYRRCLVAGRSHAVRALSGAASAGSPLIRTSERRRPPMTMTDTERTALHHKLTDVLGTKEASKLMEHLPPTGWDQLVTKDDLAASEERLGARIDGTSVRLDSTNERLDQTNERIDSTNERLDQTNERIDSTNERLDQTNVHLHQIGMQLTGLRGEFTGLRGAFEAGMTELRGAFEAGMTALRGELHLALAKSLRQTVYLVMGFTLAMWGPVMVMLLS
ncbi:MAG: hypothetical protein OXC00_07940 [Acidimicrobiaceae bacterium]|nr:hypothetical protein [Acidimicrobiaceae bacterium]